MYLDDFTAEDKETYQLVIDEVRKQLPRQATVLRVDEMGIWVTFGGLDSGETVLSSIPVPVEPGDIGWVYRVGGGKGLFVPIGGPRVYTQAEVDALTATAIANAQNFPITDQSSGSGSGASGSRHTVRTLNKTLPAGTWKIYGTATMNVRHSNTGARSMSPQISIGGTNVGGPYLYPNPANSWVVAMIAVDGTTVVSNGSSPIAFTTSIQTDDAGTVYWAGSWLNLTAYRQ